MYGAHVYLDERPRVRVALVAWARTEDLARVAVARHGAPAVYTGHDNHYHVLLGPPLAFPGEFDIPWEIAAAYLDRADREMGDPANKATPVASMDHVAVQRDSTALSESIIIQPAWLLIMPS